MQVKWFSLLTKKKTVSNDFSQLNGFLTGRHDFMNTMRLAIIQEWFDIETETIVISRKILALYLLNR
jgi:hypothetical protein